MHLYNHIAQWITDLFLEYNLIIEEIHWLIKEQIFFYLQFN